MLLGDVGDLMCQHSRQFAFCLCGENEARIDANMAGGSGKCVDFRVVDDKEVKALPGLGAVLHQLGAERLDVVNHQWVG